MRALRSGTIYITANIIAAAIPFLLLPLLTRILEPGDYGRVIGFALLVSLCQPVTGLSLHGALGVLWFRLPRLEVPAYVGTALALALGSTLIVAGAVGVLLLMLPAGFSAVSPGWGMLAALTSGANIVLQCRLVLWQSQQKPLASAAMQIGASVLNVTLSLIAVIALGWGGDGRNTGIATAALVMSAVAVFGFWQAKSLVWAPSREQLRYFLAFGLPLVVHALSAVILTTADRWAISIKLDPVALGIYGTGAQLGMVMSMLSDAFVKAYSPWMYGKLASDTGEARYSAVGAIYMGIPGFLLMGLITGLALIPASHWILGPQYRAASAILPWFMLGGAFNGVYLCTSVLFFHSSRTPRLATVTVSSSLLGATATWILVGQLGVIGAAIGYATSQGLLALLTTAMAMFTFDLPWKSPREALAIWTRDVVYALRPSP